ncbi:hypothetical protein [Stenotrophomonas sp.]|uniref:hypothetical protein n=1 Tax=Stenotrophomonas sp. TaxID=69392 RepID=UPI0028B14B90|nr:hypothetical protein [Stenotrophomonas sp.]
MQGIRIAAAFAILFSLASCRSTDTGYDGGVGFTASAQCAIQCQETYRRCAAEPRSTRLSQCESQVARNASRCSELKDPEQRRYCDMSANSCADRMPELGCGEQLSMCSSRCGG